jgi:hypothetical protein
VKPIRASNYPATLQYNATSGEIVYNTAKTFVIDHPQEPHRKYLVHGCLEGPEGGVYYRGESKVGETVVLPKYVKSLVAPGDTPTIQLTPIGYHSACPGVTRWDRETNSFRVLGDDGEVFWTFFAKRCDLPKGVEPRKHDVHVSGDGPYRYINPSLR